MVLVCLRCTCTLAVGGHALWSRVAHICCSAGPLAVRIVSLSDFSFLDFCLSQFLSHIRVFEDGGPQRGHVFLLGFMADTLAGF